MKKKKIKAIAIILTGALVVFILFGYNMGLIIFNHSMQLVNNKTTSIERGYGILSSMGFDYKALEEEYHMQGIKIPASYEEHSIPLNYFKLDEDDRDTVIMVHALKGNRVTTYPIVQMFLKGGYNVITYDQRSSGENYAPYTTYGYLESRDLIDCVKYLDKQTDKKIILWGASFGGATVATALEDSFVAGRVSCAVLDCPVSNMTHFINRTIDKLKLSFPRKYLLFCADKVTKMKLGFSFKDGDIPPKIRDTSIPILILNTKTDKTTPYYMGIDIYKAIENKDKELFTSHDSPHSRIFYYHEKEYTDIILNFIQKY